MSPLKKPMADKKIPFTIGSSLDSSASWQFLEEKKSSKTAEIKPPEKHLLVLKMEKRRGKPVSIVGAFFLEDKAMNELCAKLKKKLGSGGTCKEEWMEFQGECREKLKELLTAEGFRFKA